LHQQEFADMKDFLYIIAFAAIMGLLRVLGGVLS
jgi:hypothetical protein